MTTCTCGQPLAAGDKFCMSCGKPATVVTAADACALCGRTVTGSDSFCAGCGAALPPRQAGGSQSGHPRSFRWKWALLTIPIALGVTLAAVAAVVAVALNFGVDPDTDPLAKAVGFLAVVAGMFIGGLIVGWWSPGRTVLEPGVGLAVTSIALNLLSDNAGGILFDWILPFAVGAAGAWLGEALQSLRRRSTR